MRTHLGAVTAVACSTVLIGSALAATAGAAPVAPPSTASAPVALLLGADGRSLTVLRADTGVLSPMRKITGFKAGETALVGIDVRVQDGKTYAVGNAGVVYTVTDKGVLTKVRKLTVPLSGTAFGVDFNPAANALRIISDTGQNLRQTFVDTTTGTVEDLALNYVAGTTATGLSAAAYTNNDLSANSGTTLFDIDTALDQVVTQAPANNGTLQLTGKLGADVTDIGFDIFTQIDDTGRATDNTGYAVVPDGAGNTTLHTVSLLTGQAPVRATLTGSFGDIAIKTIPAPAA
ncbi:DUF4394 domain-containing protein [Jatrophihabitans sp. YIM 134969]